MINFEYLSIFEKKVKKINKKFFNFLNDFEELLIKLQNNPKSGIFIKNDIYKIRMKNSDLNQGKSGGYRVIYYLVNKENKIVFFDIYSKNKKDSIKDKELDMLLKKYSENI